MTAIGTGSYTIIARTAAGMGGVLDRMVARPGASGLPASAGGPVHADIPHQGVVFLGVSIRSPRR